MSLISCTATALIRILRKQHKYTERIQDNKHSDMHISFLMPYNNSAQCHKSSSCAVTMNASCNEHDVKCTDKSKQTHSFLKKKNGLTSRTQPDISLQTLVYMEYRNTSSNSKLTGCGPGDRTKSEMYS